MEYNVNQTHRLLPHLTKPATDRLFLSNRLEQDPILMAKFCAEKEKFVQKNLKAFDNPIMHFFGFHKLAKHAFRGGFNSGIFWNTEGIALKDLHPTERSYSRFPIAQDAAVRSFFLSSIPIMTIGIIAGIVTSAIMSTSLLIGGIVGTIAGSIVGISTGAYAYHTVYEKYDKYWSRDGWYAGTAVIKDAMKDNARSIDNMEKQYAPSYQTVLKLESEAGTGDLWEDKVNNSRKEQKQSVENNGRGFS